MPLFPTRQLMNNFSANLPQLSQRSFLLNGAKWELPSFDNAETFVAKMARDRMLARDAQIADAAQGESIALSTRSAQRGFLAVTGMSLTNMRQIERARFAVNLLREGVPIADVVWQCGFFDHAHLARSLRRWIGLTPTQIAQAEVQLSFLYKTAAFPLR